MEERYEKTWALVLGLSLDEAQSANDVHTYLANSSISETGRSWTIISEFLPNSNILSVTEIPECPFAFSKSPSISVSCSSFLEGLV